jgi:hypothetical protein
MITRWLTVALLASLAACDDGGDGGTTPTFDAAPGTPDSAAGSADASPATPDAAPGVIKSVTCDGLPTDFTRQVDLPMNDYFAQVCFSGVTDSECRVTSDQFDAMGLACGGLLAFSIRIQPGGATVSASNGWNITNTTGGTIQGGGVAVSDIATDDTEVIITADKPGNAAYQLAITLPDASTLTVSSFSTF